MFFAATGELIKTGKSSLLVQLIPKQHLATEKFLKKMATQLATQKMVLFDF